MDFDDLLSLMAAMIFAGGSTSEADSVNHAVSIYDAVQERLEAMAQANATEKPRGVIA